MTTLAEIYHEDKVALSFELFPPKSDAGDGLLQDHIQQLMTFDPAFLTCTYGAGGSTRDKTLDVCQTTKANSGKPIASHLTVVGSTVDELRAYLDEAAKRGIDYIVALRGDPPKGADSFTATEGGYRYANELVELIRAEYSQFGVLVAGYPETHSEAPSPQADLDNLKRKVDAGADAIVTQLFYNNDDYFRFVDRCQASGIQVPIIPGILPVTNLAQIRRLSSMCGASLPADLVSDLEKHDDRDWQFQVGVDFATQQVQQLLSQSISGLHFYVLNKSTATAAVLRAVSTAV